MEKSDKLPLSLYSVGERKSVKKIRSLETVLSFKIQLWAMAMPVGVLIQIPWSVKSSLRCDN